jgi:hypothetical protein
MGLHVACHLWIRTRVLERHRGFVEKHNIGVPADGFRLLGSDVDYRKIYRFRSELSTDRVLMTWLSIGRLVSAVATALLLGTCIWILATIPWLPWGR